MNSEVATRGGSERGDASNLSCLRSSAFAFHEATCVGQVDATPMSRLQVFALFAARKEGAQNAGKRNKNIVQQQETTAHSHVPSMACFAVVSAGVAWSCVGDAVAG
jgi:hypothetical protein